MVKKEVMVKVVSDDIEIEKITLIEADYDGLRVHMKDGKTVAFMLQSNIITKMSALDKKDKPDWAMFFYQELGYRIVEDAEQEEALNKAMEKIFGVWSKTMTGQLGEV